MNERQPISDTDDGRTHLELYVRSLSPAGARSRQDAVISRLAALAERDAIGEYVVHVWGTGVRPASAAAHTASGTFAVERLAAFEDWAARNEVALSSAFHTKEVHSTLTGKAYIERSFPVLTLAALSGPKLRCVAPYREGSSTYSVEDCLDAIEDGRVLVGKGFSKPLPVGRDRRKPADPGTDPSVEDGPNPFAIPGSVGE